MFTTRNAVIALAMCSVAVLLAAFSGCTSEASDGVKPIVDGRVRGMRDLAAVGDQESTEQLIDGLGDESESVRIAAQRGLEDVLKRKIYFDVAASAADRDRALGEVRAMWQNIKDRDLFEVAKERMPIQYFYDLNTEEIFEARAGMAPIETSSGSYEGMPAGVRAVVFACRDCGDDRYVAWLQAPIVELKRYGVAYDSAGVGGEPEKSDLAIRSPDGGKWVPLAAPAAEAITTAARRCDDRPTPLYCRPGR